MTPHPHPANLGKQHMLIFAKDKKPIELMNFSKIILEKYAMIIQLKQWQ